METATKYEPKTGDIFYTSWGYDQTNVDYYCVIEVSKTGKTLKLREVASLAVDDNGPSTHVIPNSTELMPNLLVERWCRYCRAPVRISRYGSTTGKLVHERSDTIECLDHDGRPTGTKARRMPPKIYTKRLKLSGYDGKPVLNWASYANAYLWDGKPKYETGFGWGH